MGHDPAERAYKSPRQRRGPGGIVGMPRVDARGRARPPMAADNDPNTGAWARGCACIVYPYGDADSRREFRKRCRKLAVMTAGIGEPLGAGANGEWFAAYRCVGGADALDALTRAGCVRESHYDCPVKSDGLPRAYTPADGVDVRRLPPVPPEARRVVRPDSHSEYGRTVLAAGLPDDGTPALAPGKIVTRPPGRGARPSKRAEPSPDTRGYAADREPAARAVVRPAEYVPGAVSAYPRGAMRIVREPAGPSYPGINECVYMPEYGPAGDGI